LRHCVEAEELNRALDHWREGLGEVVVELGTLPWLTKLYRSTELFEDLAPKTQRSYEQGLALLEAWSKDRGHPPIAGLQTRHVREMLRTIERPAMRHLAYRTLRLLLSFAVAEGSLERNPAKGLRIKGSRPREVYWMPEQQKTFKDAARAAGRPSMALATDIGAELGQREGDTIRLSWPQYDGGNFTLRQAKTKRLISVPATRRIARGARCRAADVANHHHFGDDRKSSGERRKACGSKLYPLSPRCLTSLRPRPGPKARRHSCACPPLRA
jgi:hypothetical protein